MRAVETCILRMLIDTDDPQALRGAVRTVTDDEERPFADEQALLALLRQIGLAKLRKLAAASPEMASDSADYAD